MVERCQALSIVNPNLNYACTRQARRVNLKLSSGLFRSGQGQQGQSGEVRGEMRGEVRGEVRGER